MHIVQVCIFLFSLGVTGKVLDGYWCWGRRGNEVMRGKSSIMRKERGNRKKEGMLKKGKGKGWNAKKKGKGRGWNAKKGKGLEEHKKEC